MEPLVHIVAGKQGRMSVTKPSHELLAVEENLPLDTETLDECVIAEIAKKVLELAPKYSGHRFDEEYMAQNKGAYGISTLTIDTEYNVHPYVMPVFRPTSPGGHTVFRTALEIEKVLEITHADIPVENAGAMEIGLYMSKFKGLECVLIVPATMKNPKLFRALNLETKGDGSDTTTLVSVRLCDTLGLGRSTPRLSTGKFKFLFPGVPLDTSLVKSKKSKRKREESIEEVTQSAWDALNSMLSECVQKTRADGYDKTTPDYKAKSYLYLMAQRFLDIFDINVGRDRFEQVFAIYTSLPADICLETLGNKKVIRSIIESNVDDIQSRDSLHYEVDSYEQMISV